MLKVKQLEVELAVCVLSVHGGLVTSRADGEGPLEDQGQLSCAPTTTCEKQKS